MKEVDKMTERKFEEAFCEAYNDCISVEKVEHLLMNVPDEYERIKGTLRCPECKIAPLHLSHRLGNAHLKIMPGKIHDEECSVRNSYISQRNFRKYVEDVKNMDNLNLKLKRCINQLVGNDTVKPSNEILNFEGEEDKSGMVLAWKGSTYAIPRKRLNCNLQEGDIDVWKMFYGNNRLEWKFSNNANKHYLHVCTEQNVRVCDIWFSEKVYSFLSLAMKSVAPGTYGIALFGEMHRKGDYTSITCINSKLIEIRL